MKEIKLTVKGKIVPNNTKSWVNPATGHVQHYKPKKVKEYKMLIQTAVAEYCLKNQFKPLDVPVVMSLHIHLALPLSMSKKRRQELLGKPAPKKPDLDNCTKLILDAISGDAWNKEGYHLLTNDSRVCDLHVCKTYAEENYIEITLSAIKD